MYTLHFLALYKTPETTIQQIAQELALPDRVFSRKKMSTERDLTLIHTDDGAPPSP